MEMKKPRYNEILFTQEEENQIKQLYLDGKSTVKIGEEFGVSHKKIARILDKYEIKRVGNGRRKYALNETYFDKIDTPNKAYILGFLSADGYNSLTKQTVAMSLQEDDMEILEKIRLEIKSEKPLIYIDYSQKHDGGYTYKNQYKLEMYSSRMCANLSKLGVIPNKSLVLKFPNLPKDLLFHFIRGYYDGDGSVYFRKSQAVIIITNTGSFCKTVKEIVDSNLHINSYIYDASNRNGITKVFTISGNKQAKIFLDALYSDADLYMLRKYQRYTNHFYS